MTSDSTAPADATAPAPAKKPNPYSTSYLLTIAAIAAATAILLVVGNWIAYATAAVPWLNGVTLGLWVVPFALAMRLLPLPGTTLLVALFAGIVMAPFQPDGFRSIMVNLWYGFFFEIFFAVTLYRVRRLWLFLLAGALNGAAWGVLVVLALDVTSLQPWTVPVTIIVPAVSGALGAWLGVLIADALVKAGVGATTRKRLDERRAAKAAARASA